MKKIAKIHYYRGWRTGVGQCGLEIFEPSDGVPVIVLTQLPSNGEYERHEHDRDSCG